MPPRIPALTCLRAPTSQFTLPLRPFSTSSSLATPPSLRPTFKKKVSHDPYILAQRAQKKAATLSRAAQLTTQREESLGDPVRGVPTPFVESFTTGLPLTHAPGAKIPKDELHLNYALKPAVVEKQLTKSKRLAVPLPEMVEKSASEQRASRDPYGGSYRISQPQPKQLTPEEIEAKREADHARAAEALARITALENGSSKDRLRVNITRCVSTFGRHNTDHLLPPRAPPLPHVPAPGAPVQHAIRPATNAEAAKKRIGPDTGSSEVQIAILTAKIKTLTGFLEQRGKNDKHNKRNLRLLVHRRQKLLQYLRRKERGGPRWQHCIETLGLTEGTWKGEISL